MSPPTRTLAWSKRSRMRPTLVAPSGDGRRLVYRLPTKPQKEASVHAVVVKVKINDSEAAESHLRETVVPGVSQAPGFVAGYWTRKDNTGLSMIVFDSEDAANRASRAGAVDGSRCGHARGCRGS
jgi:hypothetical protein